MNLLFRSPTSAALRLLLVVALMPGVLATAAAQAPDAAALKTRHSEMRERLANSSFGRPIHLESAELSGALQGNVYAVMEHPFAMVQQALRPADHWCDILILHLNVKGCRSSGAGGDASRLFLSVGKKHDQSLEEAYKLEFAYRLAAASAEHLQIQLTADKGPLGTHDYRIRLEAIPIDARRTFLHMSYSYSYGFAARMAMQAYLGTLGRDKVGFSIKGRKPNGEPAFIGGVLGVVERNTMRYFLAIESYLGAYSLPPAQQPEKRIQAWYDATQRYAAQLHEMERADYIEMKRSEIRRQKAGPG